MRIGCTNSSNHGLSRAHYITQGHSINLCNPEVVMRCMTPSIFSTAPDYTILKCIMHKCPAEKKKTEFLIDLMVVMGILGIGIGLTETIMFSTVMVLGGMLTNTTVLNPTVIHKHTYIHIYTHTYI